MTAPRCASRFAASSLGLVAFLLVLVVPAMAAPAFQVSLRNDANEIQEVRDYATAGQFRLRFEGAETVDLAAQPGAADVQTALNALPTVAAGGGSVSVNKEGPAGALRYYVRFDGGPLAGADVPMLSAVAGTTPPTSSGPVPTVGVASQQPPGLRRRDERVTYTVDVANVGDAPTSGTVTLELELPGGAETELLETGDPLGWTCSGEPAMGSEPAKAICTRSSTLGIGGSWEGLTITAALGPDVPPIAAAEATVSGGGALAGASATDEIAIGSALPFAVESFDAAILDLAGDTYTRAGGHPFLAKANFAFTKHRARQPFNNLEAANHFPTEESKHIIVDTPPGFVGNARALPMLCESPEKLISPSVCPPASAVGGITIKFGSGLFVSRIAIYAIEPEFGVPAEFGFYPGNGVYTFVPRLRPEEGYAIRFESAPNTEVQIISASPELCGFGAKITGSSTFAGCKSEAEALAADPEAKPLMTNPTSCEGAPIATIRSDSWQQPGALRPDGAPDLSDPRWKSTDFANPPVTECGDVPFEPTSEVSPTSNRADSPTGLEVEMTMPTEGLEKPTGCHLRQGDPSSPSAPCVSQANLKTAKVTFPEGMAVNATAGQGLGACTKDQIKLGTNEPISCPQSSKIGTVEIETPILDDTLTGDVYVARQGDIDDALVGFYLVFDSPENGVLVKIPARVEFDQKTGRLVSVVEGSPQQPFSAVRIRFPQAPRSPLLNPPKCGHYEVETQLIPWTGGASVTDRSGFDVTQGPNGGPCPSGGLAPSFEAGSANPLAAHTTPFNIRLHRPDGSDRFSSLSLGLPPGLTAYLKGIPYCPDATLASIPSAPGTGQAEIDHPSCPAASQIGKVTVGAGAGDNPLYVDTAKAYLSGPYKGAPLSIAVVAPAVAGPLDLGNVVIRNALYLDPRTAEVKAVSDPIPTILHGILLDVRDVRVQIDRPAFTLNPTNCDPMAVGATVGGLSGQSAALSNRFQVGGCESLGFKPSLKTRLFGGTGRGAFPAFRATYEPRQGDANLKDLALRFPRSEFIEQGHFRTICTRVQYAANSCPAGSIYGHISATTPLLDQPLEGPVYLRSSDHNLPDVVFALHGQVDAEAVVRIDSKKGGLRASIEGAPDVPITKVTLDMQGGAKGLFVNSRNLCASTFRSSLRAGAHNGARFEARPALINGKCKKAKRKRQRHRASRG